MVALFGLDHKLWIQAGPLEFGPYRAEPDVVFGPEKLGALPETVERRLDGAGHKMV